MEATLNGLNKQLNELPAYADSNLRKAIELEIAQTEAHLTEAKSIHDTREAEEKKNEAEEVQKKFDAELKQLEAERLKALGDKTSIDELQREVAKWGPDTDRLNGEVVAASVLKVKIAAEPIPLMGVVEFAAPTEIEATPLSMVPEERMLGKSEPLVID